jgi:hypothetical protein
MASTLIVSPRTASLPTAESSADIYVRVTVGTRMERTDVSTQGGNSPNWSDDLSFSIINENTIKIGVW